MAERFEKAIGQLKARITDRYPRTVVIYNARGMLNLSMEEARDLRYMLGRLIEQAEEADKK